MRRTVLIVDDDAPVRRFLRTAVESVGHKVLESATGKKALSLAFSESVDVIVTDILMPEMDGIELIRQLRKGLPKVKIVALSGGGLVGDVPLTEWARKLGADATLRKPINLATLLSVVEDNDTALA